MMELKSDEGRRVQAYASLEEVRAAMRSTGYPWVNFVFVPGRVEETLPGTATGEIALLRLDTDWYESTYHELQYLWPRLVTGGVLILDDYGHWQGAKRAVDEYFSRSQPRPELHVIDYTARLILK